MKPRRNRNRNPNPHLSRQKNDPSGTALLNWWRQQDPAGDDLQPSGRSAAAIMPKVLQELGLDRRRAEAEVLRVWNNLIDPNIVSHAQPSGLHKGTLFVTVDNCVWLSEIVRFRSKEILERLQHSFGPDLICKISYRVG